MIRIKLDLPEEVINFNSQGLLTSVPVPYAPNTIKPLGMRVEITGYVSDNDFFAFRMTSSERCFAVGEQLTLLRALGFKTVPFIMNEQTAGDSLITIKDRFKQYNPEWIYANSGKVLTTPEIVNIQSCKWKMINKALTLQVTTDKGTFPIVDMRYIEYFQPHGKAKLADGELKPYMTTRVTVPIPDVCPKCNNPLKRMQPYPDLPLFFKCTSKFCEQLVADEPDTPVEPEQEVQVDENSFRTSTESEVSEQPVAEEPVLNQVVEEEAPVAETITEAEEPVEFTEEVEGEGTSEEMVEETTDTLTHGESSVTTTNENICLVDVKVDSDDVAALVEAGKIVVTEDVAEAKFILVKNRRSVSQYIRDLAKENDLEMKPIADFQ